MQANNHTSNQNHATDTLSRAANGLVLWVAKHWLLLFNSAWGFYLFLPILAPIFVQLGWYAPARVIYSVYSVLCHQLPDHSYFLFGANPVPLTPDLVAAGMPATSDLFVQRKFIGNDQIGYKVAICERDVAIYGSVFLAGLVYGLLRPRLRPLSFKSYLLFLVPLAVDGLTQMVGWRESNWWLRTVTGTLFGVASVWLAYPYVDDAMESVIEDEAARRALEEHMQSQSTDPLADPPHASC